MTTALADAADPTIAEGESLLGVEIFAAGVVQAGNMDAPETWTAADLEAIVRNFEALAKRGRPLLIPRVKIGHEAAPAALDWSGLPAYGRVDKLAVEDGRLVADFAGVPPLVKAWIAAGLYGEVSPEINGEAADPSLLATAAREGVEIVGPYLQAVAFLGSAPPANKDILGLKQPGQYRERRLTIRSTRAATLKGRRRYFAEVTMDPTTLDLPGKLDWLDQQGFDTTSLRAIADPAQQEAAVNAAVDFCMKVQPAATGTADASQQKPGDRNPSQVVLKYSEADLDKAATAAVEKALSGHAARLAQLDEAAKARQATDARLATERHFAQARQDAQRLADDGYLRAADLECDAAGQPLPHTELFALAHASTAKTRTFAEGGKNVVRSEYEITLNRIKAKGKRQYGERVVQDAKSGTVDRFQRAKDQAVAALAKNQPSKPLSEIFNQLPARGLR